MTGQIAGPSIFSLELVGLVIGVSMIVGAVDLIRQPGWAWKRAEESKVAYLILVVLLPAGRAGHVRLPGPAQGGRRSPPAGRAASLPFERFGEDADQKQREERADRSAAIAHRSGSAASARWPPTTTDPAGSPRPGPSRRPGRPVEISQHLLQQRRVGHPLPPVARSAWPGPTAPSSGPASPSPIDAEPTVPAGWKADPTGRHQFRYWDGFHWTENVADAGEQSRDSVSS